MTDEPLPKPRGGSRPGADIEPLMNAKQGGVPDMRTARLSGYVEKSTHRVFVTCFEDGMLVSEARGILSNLGMEIVNSGVTITAREEDSTLARCAQMKKDMKHAVRAAFEQRGFRVTEG